MGGPQIIFIFENIFVKMTDLKDQIGRISDGSFTFADLFQTVISELGTVLMQKMISRMTF